MKTILKGKKTKSISVNGDTICWTSFADYNCRKLPENEAENAAGEAAAAFSGKHFDNECSTASAAKPAEKLLNAKINEPPKIIKDHVSAATQCHLGQNDFKCADIKQVYNEINAVFLKRTVEVETQLPADLELQIKTHEEWCQNLLKCSTVISESMNDLLTDFKRFANERLTVSKADTKFELDCGRLTKLIQRRVQTGAWCLEDLQLETLPFKEILNPDSDYLSEELSSPRGDHRHKAKLKSPFTKPKT